LPRSPAARSISSVSIDGNDIIAVGEDRPPLRLSPRNKQIALLVAGALLSYAGWRLIGADADPSPRPTAAPPTSSPAVASPRATTAPVPSAPASTVAPPQRATLLPLPPEDVLPMGAPTGARLVLGGSVLVDLAVDTGNVTDTHYPGRIRQTLHVRDGDVVLVATAGQRAAAAWYVPSHRMVSLPIGQATAVVPAVDDAHVWLVDPAAPGLVHKVDLRGSVERTADLGPWRVAIRETAYGMVTTSSVKFSSSLELWDLTAGRVARTDWVAQNFIVADADAEHTALTLPFCDLPMCPVKVVSTRSGEVIDAAMPLGWATSKAAFSPDGTKLAVIGRQVSRNAPDEPAVVVTDLASGGFRRASGVEPGQFRAGLAWSGDSRWLFALADLPATPLLGYRLGDRRVRYVPFPRRARDLDPADLTSLSAY
jgi:hypothetical protein